MIPTAQGVILFSENQQFIMFADAGVLDTWTITAIGLYPTMRWIKGLTLLIPVRNINFISKTPGYSTCSMNTRGQQENPQVIDLSRIVKEWISPDY